MSRTNRRSFDRAVLRQLKENGFSDLTASLPFAALEINPPRNEDVPKPQTDIGYIMEAVEKGMNSTDPEERAYWYREFKRRAWESGRHYMLPLKQALLWRLRFIDEWPAFGQPYYYDPANQTPVSNAVAPSTKPYQPVKTEDEKTNPFADFFMHLPEYIISKHNRFSGYGRN